MHGGASVIGLLIVDTRTGRRCEFRQTTFATAQDSALKRRQPTIKRYRSYGMRRYPTCSEDKLGYLKIADLVWRYGIIDKSNIETDEPKG